MVAPLCAASALTYALLAAGSLDASPQAGNAASPDSSRTRARVERLASEAFGGREAGSDGERLAAAFIADELARIGARPLPGRRDMFVPFEFTAGSRDGKTAIVITSASGPAAGRRFDNQQVDALSFSESAKVLREIVPLVNAGVLTPPELDSIAIEQGPRAYQAVLERSARRKQVIQF